MSQTAVTETLPERFPAVPGGTADGPANGVAARPLPPVNDPDDLAPQVPQRRQEAQAALAAEDMLRRVRDRRRGSTANGQPSAPGAPTTDQPQPARQPQEAAGSMMGRIASDIGRGIVETPRALAGAIPGAVNEAVQAVYDVGAALRRHGVGPDGYLRVNLSGDGPALSWQQGEVPREEQPQAPELDRPESTTGGLVRDVAQWLVGFAAAGRLKPVQAMAGMGRAGTVAAAAARGAVADFAFMDEAQERLASLVQQHPDLANPVTEFLASHDGDTAAESRAKLALEGLGLGMTTDAALNGLRAVRAWGIARREAAAQGSEQALARQVAEAANAPRVEGDAFHMLGDEAAPPLTTPDRPAPVRSEGSPPTGPKDTPPVMQEGATEAPPAPRAAESAVPPEAPGALDNATPTAVAQGSSQELGGVFVNWARIDTPDDVKSVMQGMADAMRGDIDAARRGTMTFRKITDGAAMEDAWSVLMQRRQGAPLNAEQSVAARTLWAESADKLAQVAREAADNPSEVNLFAFRKMLTVHHAIQQEVIAARTETARALASWRIPAGGAMERARAVADALASGGGTDATREAASRVAALAKAGMGKEIAVFAEKSAGAATRDALIEAWTMALLSAPKTHVVNATSNLLVLAQQMAERRAAGGISDLMGHADGVDPGEALAMFHGLVGSLGDAFRYAGKALRTGETGYGLGKLELPREGAISSAAFGMATDTWPGRVVDALGALVRLPGRALGASDEFFKTVAHRMELHARAHRQAVRDVAGGVVEPGRIKERMADILADPPEDLRLAAVDFADYSTFTNAPGALASALQRMTGEYPLLKVLVPFVRTPANIMRFAFERTPLAPLMQHVRTDLAAGGARKDIALARMSMGTAVMLAGMDAAMNDKISGSGPKSGGDREALKRTGWQPYSVKVGDRWFAYGRLDPLGMQLGIAADMAETLRNMDGEVDKDAERVAVAAVAAIGNTALSKTYLSGLSSFFQAMGDPDRYAESWAQKLAGSMVPAGVAAVARADDPYLREVRSMVDAMKARTPGMSETLPPARDLWGRPISWRSGLGWAYDAFSPVGSTRQEPQPIDAEIMRLGVQVGRPGSRVAFDGVPVDLHSHPGAYSRFLELAGNGVKHPAWQLGAMDFLNQVVEGKHSLSSIYHMRSDGPDGMKGLFIQDTLRSFRDLAKVELLKEYPAIRHEVDDKRRAMLELRLPVTGQTVR